MCGSGTYVSDWIMLMFVLDRYFNYFFLKNYNLVKVDVIYVRVNWKLIIYGKKSLEIWFFILVIIFINRGSKIDNKVESVLSWVFRRLGFIVLIWLFNCYIWVSYVFFLYFSWY